MKEATLTQCKIIRDSDKTDIYYILITDSIENTYETKSFRGLKISKEMIDDFYYHLIDYSHRKNPLDTVVCHLAYIFDFNYDCARNIVKEKQYIEKMLENIEIEDEETKMILSKMYEEIKRSM